MALDIGQLEDLIEEERYYKIGEKTVAAVLILESEFEAVGFASCVDSDDFNFEAGKKYARKDAVEKMWELEGYRRHWL